MKDGNEFEHNLKCLANKLTLRISFGKIIGDTKCQVLQGKHVQKGYDNLLRPLM